MSIGSHRDLVVWQKSMLLAKEVYGLAKRLPKAEEYRLTSQLLRSAASVPANIAEGHARGSRKDYKARQYRAWITRRSRDFPDADRFG